MRMCRAVVMTSFLRPSESANTPPFEFRAPGPIIRRNKEILILCVFSAWTRWWANFN